MGTPKPLTESQIETELDRVPGWTRDGDTISRTFNLRYHAGVAVIVHVADRERRIGHHADIDLRMDHITFSVTTHDADFKLTQADFDLAARIDAIVAAHQAIPLD
ncbi:4a-hydroxytetrahydrobiopterin dehydratase [Streptomyces sp. ISL-36]|uniref:4a-hydroxytetrahydrobiopterin dehydratase n=1 Tax=Streptomyces sp. ISL-36 TaxID=2819182 RepID=UPI001BE76FF4|nr:4a-hydroxytetrahydrobiopterin dehydratase [Streptomyces sp. ISL-36]MBT2438818.1 4a-hydroxytetrahydrobiopterin dehydratase [Streptomyces sp. ISL-36]